MSIGLIALFDHIAAIAKVAAASLDDVAAQSAHAGVKAAGVVIDSERLKSGTLSALGQNRSSESQSRIRRHLHRRRILKSFHESALFRVLGGGFPPFKASLIAEQISMSINVKAFRYVYYRDIPDYLDMGWMADIPPDFARLNWYGIVMVWLCECKIPGGTHDKRQMAGGPGLTPAIFERGPSSEIAIAIIE